MSTKRPFINDSNRRSSVELSPVGYTLATCEAILSTSPPLFGNQNEYIPQQREYVTLLRVLTRDQGRSGRFYQAEPPRQGVRALNSFNPEGIEPRSLLTGIADHIEFCYVQVILRRSVARVAIL